MSHEHENLKVVYIIKIIKEQYEKVKNIYNPLPAQYMTEVDWRQ